MDSPHPVPADRIPWRARPDAWLTRIDPCEEAGAEPLTIWPVAALCAALAASVTFFLRWKYQPMQDLGHHMALAAIAMDWGRPGSLYTGLYLPLDPLAANSLLYTAAALLGRAVGATWAVRLLLLAYVAGLPLALLWSLRVFGRSAWGAVAGVSLVYGFVHVMGFANLLFAAPFLLLALTQFWRALARPTAARILAAAALFCVLFLAHAHAYLWLGALCATALAQALWRSRRSVPGPPRVAAAAAACGLPSLLLLARWYAHAFGARPRGDGALMGTVGAGDGFGASFTPIGQALRALPGQLGALRSGADVALLAGLALLGVVALALSRRDHPPRPRVLEIAFALTLASYFLLPESVAGHEMIGSRQPSIALWFFPALLAPVPASVSRWGRRVVVAGLLAFTAAHLALWGQALSRFEAEEASGLDEVISAAPPRLNLHFVKLDPDSRFFLGHALWHVEKYYLSEKLGHTPDTSGLRATAPVHYRSGATIHRITLHTPDWPFLDEIWRNFDLVLVRRWLPSPRALEAARARWRLTIRAGDWELWERRP